jgi:aminomethyltransferase
VADRYQMSEKFEYFAVRNAAGVFDTSPLYKYRITGSDAEFFLSGVLARDIRTCRPGRAQYTIWCDDDGYVLEDGVVLRLADDEFLLTAARPNLAYLESLVGNVGRDPRTSPTGMPPWPSRVPAPGRS